MAITVGGMASLVPSQGVLRVGDKVMAKTYDADAGLVPGDMGVVVEFLPNSEAGGFLVRFDSLLPTRNLLIMYEDQLEDETTSCADRGCAKIKLCTARSVGRVAQ